MRLPALSDALERAAHALGASDGVQVRLERPQNPEHGDLATNLAMVLAGELAGSPREIAARLLEQLDLAELRIADAEIAGPGFINFRVSPDYLREALREIAGSDGDYGRSDWGVNRRVNIEFVSANPTGPLHVGHGRGAAVGDTLARLLERTGHDVHSEFYVNDAGVQIDKLVDSIRARFLELLGEPAQIPEGGYHGDYVVELAREVQGRFGDGLGTGWTEADRDSVQTYVLESIRAEQEDDLRALGVEFDTFTPESSLYRSGAIEEVLEALEGRQLVYPSEGATWIETSRFGDDKDRVLVKSDGTYTYFLPDIAYHWDKARRGFDVAIDIWGADHHGYVDRMRAAMKAIGQPEDFFEALIVQLVRVERGGEEVKFSKRAGEFVTLRDLIDEVGPDVARYFFLERRAQQQMVFDLDLALERSEKNPVYKIQYALARMRSIYRKGGFAAESIDLDADLEPLAHETELAVAKTLLDFPETVDGAAEAREPHRLAAYLEGLANEVNSWYHAGNRDKSLRVLGVEGPLSQARLVLTRAIEVVLRNGLQLLGLSTPERM